MTRYGRWAVSSVASHPDKESAGESGPDPRRRGCSADPVEGTFYLPASAVREYPRDASFRHLPAHLPYRR